MLMNYTLYHFRFDNPDTENEYDPDPSSKTASFSENPAIFIHAFPG